MVVSSASAGNVAVPMTETVAVREVLLDSPSFGLDEIDQMEKAIAGGQCQEVLRTLAELQQRSGDGEPTNRDALVIGVTNPTSLALLKPPGQWGQKGADIACGEGQPLGVPLSSGGPYFGFMVCRETGGKHFLGLLQYMCKRRLQSFSVPRLHRTTGLP